LRINVTEASYDTVTLGIRGARLTPLNSATARPALVLSYQAAIESNSPDNQMRSCCTIVIRNAAIAALLWTALPHAAGATGAEPATDPQIDPAPCLAAAATNDADRIIAICGALIDNEKTMRADRIKALIERAGAYNRNEMIERAIGDYDTVLRLDPTLADILNARGELWRRKGDRPHALADFGAALKLNPQHQTARANYKSLAQELERLGAQMAIKSRSNPPPNPSPPLKPGTPLKSSPALN
jgi:tetratricopeptide (TPR) repeat protein